MMKMAREFRLLPIVLVATICLFVLKVSGLVFDGGYTLADRLRDRAKPPGLTVTSGASIPEFPTIKFASQNAAPDRPAAKVPWAQEMFNFNGTESPKSEVTGSVAGIPPASGAKSRTSATNSGLSDDITYSSGGGAPKPPPDAGPPLKTSEKPPGPPRLDVGGDAQPLTPGKINSPGERAILGRLQDRRQELDDRSKELEMRESLMKAAEKRLEAKASEFKELEARMTTTTAAQEKAEADRFKGIVAMYENMKPKDAARIFERLDIRILVEVALAMKPRTMSEILAAMSPDAAQRLTVELANYAVSQSNKKNAGELPKIEGTPNKS